MTMSFVRGYRYEIHVVFTKIEVHAAGGDADANSTSSAGWKVLFEDSAGVDVDLLNVTGTQAAFLGEASLAAGKYTQLRITVASAHGVQDGNDVAITVSSGTLKFNRPFDVDAEKETRLVIDVDLDKSLNQSGSGTWRMTPVVGSVSATVVEDSSSGDDVADEGDVESVSA